MRDEKSKPAKYVEIKPPKYQLFDKIDMFAQADAAGKIIGEKEEKPHEQLRRPTQSN